MTISENLKAARAALGLTQIEIAAQSGVSSRSYQGYEDGRSVPGGDAISGFVRLGINANWLLTGEGPMLVADLLPKPEPIKINADAMVQAIMVALQTAPKTESQETSIRKGIKFYQYCLDEDLITPEGLGPGSAKDAA